MYRSNIEDTLRKYRTHAPGYDASAQRTMPLRRRVVALLGLRPGETVLDVACGTGLSLSLLREAVGPAGPVVGVEVSPDMIRFARDRVAAEGMVHFVIGPKADAAVLLEVNCETDFASKNEEFKAFGSMPSCSTIPMTCSSPLARSSGSSLSHGRARVLRSPGSSIRPRCCSPFAFTASSRRGLMSAPCAAWTGRGGCFPAMSLIFAWSR